jgi:hypothetical protein
MSDLSLFFAENAVDAGVEEFAVSERFIQRDASGKPILDDKGKPIPVKWKLVAISEDENAAIRKSCTQKVRGKNGVQVPETDYTAYMAKLVARCVTFPNLHDAKLQESYKVRGADELVKKMLLSGEYAGLVAKVQEINGFDRDVNELADEVKN